MFVINTGVVELRNYDIGETLRCKVTSVAVCTCLAVALGFSHSMAFCASIAVKTLEHDDVSFKLISRLGT